MRVALLVSVLKPRPACLQSYVLSSNYNWEEGDSPFSSFEAHLPLQRLIGGGEGFAFVLALVAY